MKGVVLPGDKTLELRDFPTPEPGPGEVLIQMKVSGLCGSDLHFYRTPKDQVPVYSHGIIRGHEPSGVIVQLGPCTRNVKVGDRVMVQHYFTCGTCEHCRSGWIHFCKQVRVMGTHEHGSHADYMISPDTSCVKLPDELSFEEGAILACGMATVWQALVQLDVSGRDTLVIFGQGPVGISATMVAKAMGTRLITVDTLKERLDLSKEVGADVTINALDGDPVDAIMKLTDGKGADATMDTSGSDQGRINCFRCSKICGKVSLVGERGVTSFDISALFLRKQITVYGVWTFSLPGLINAADFAVKHKLPLKKMISHRFPITQADEAFKTFNSGKTNKVLFVWP